MTDDPALLEKRQVVDSEGEPIGAVKKHVGQNYVEIEREGPSWFVPLALLQPEGKHYRLDFTSQLSKLESQ